VPQIEGSEHLALSVDELWRRLNEPSVLGQAIPGCREMTADGEGQFRTTLDIAVGAVRGTYDGVVCYRDLEPPQHCTIAIDGKGTHGSIQGHGKLSLVPTADGTTVEYVGKFDIQGRVAGVGARVISGVSRKLIVETLRNLAAIEAASVDTAAHIGAEPAGAAAEPFRPLSSPLQDLRRRLREWWARLRASRRSTS
jgi:carbon monoxide dehydrogenase subunit G